MNLKISKGAASQRSIDRSKLRLLSVGILVLSIITIWPSTTLQAQFLTEKPLVPTPESRLWIHGTTSVSDYECKAQTIRGFGFLSDPAAADSADEPVAVVELQVPVQELDCGKQGINRDMYAALKSESHPYIHYELTNIVTESVDAANLQDTTRWLSIRAEGKLAIAGSTRTVRMKVRGRRLPGQKVRVKGKKKLNMKSYGVDPPTALFGLVKVADSLTVHYDLVTTPTDTLARRQLRQMLHP
jgi:hypothetical protein